MVDLPSKGQRLSDDAIKTCLKMSSGIVAKHGRFGAGWQGGQEARQDLLFLKKEAKTSGNRARTIRKGRSQNE
jgi:hypothetical protein